MKHQLKRSYGYSYVNNDGKGFSDTEPFGLLCLITKTYIL